MKTKQLVWGNWLNNILRWPQVAKDVKFQFNVFSFNFFDDTLKSMDRPHYVGAGIM